MTANRFFIKGKIQKSSTVFLSGTEHHHLRNVVRIRPGEEVHLFNEAGGSFVARVEEVGKEKTRLFVLHQTKTRKPRVVITLGQGLLKSKKMDFVIQKATELGVVTFVPVVTARSIVRTDSLSERKMERWRRIALEASKQSGRSRLPDIHPPVRLEGFLSMPGRARRLFFSEKGGPPLKDILMRPFQEGRGEPESPDEVRLLVGPEGGWTEGEVRDILSAGFEAASLGSLVLRAETAAVVSVAVVSLFWNA